VSRAILHWLLASGIDSAHIDPGKPWQNGQDESFNGKFCYERLNVEWCRNRHEATVPIEQWRQHDNAVRPHSSLGYRTPHDSRPPGQPESVTLIACGPLISRWADGAVFRLGRATAL
jgi:transposase InsO family protein